MPAWSAAAFTRPCDGEALCGDAAVVLPTTTGLLLSVIDGLGHGQRAWETSTFAAKWLRTHAHADVEAIAAGLCEELRATEGAAIGICHVEHDTGHIEYAGIGNTVLRTFCREREGRLVSRDGVAGLTLVQPKAYSADVEPGDLLLLCSDGIRSHFRIAEGESLRALDSATAARLVVTRFGKHHDDAACIAARWDIDRRPASELPPMA